MDEFEKSSLSSKEKKIFKEVQSQIAYCAYCQPYDSGEPVWIHGDKVELDDLFFDYELSDKSIEKIKEHLFCPYCGHEDFSWDYEIGVKSDYEKKIEKLMAEVSAIHGTDLKRLIKFIEKNPLLVYKDPLAQDVFNEIERKGFPVTEVKGKFYRARKVENSNILDSDELHCPPMGKSHEGRFNHSGQSHLYLASDIETAINEVSSDCFSQLIWYQEFVVKNKVGNIIDLSYTFGDISLSSSVLCLALTECRDAIYKDGGNKENWKPDYFLTRFIMDCAKYCGYNGIKYNSTKSVLGYNVVLFFPEKIKLIPVNRPKIFIFMKNAKEDVFESTSSPIKWKELLGE